MKTLALISDVARAIVEQLAPKVRDIEVRIVRSDGYGYELRNRELAPELSLGRVSVGLRALTEKGLALSATSTLDLDENVRAIEAALGAAQKTPLTSLGTARYPASSSGHDLAWETWATEPARLRDLAAALRDRTFAAGEASGRTLGSVEGGVSFGTQWMALATREGEAAFKRSSGGVFVRIDAGHYKVQHLERAPDADTLAKLEALGEATLAEIPPRVLAPAELGAGGGRALPVLLHPRLVENMIRAAASEKFLGASRNTGLSGLREGDAVWDPAITLIDTGREPGLSTSRPCDDELRATGETPLVERGHFASHVWSARSALEAADPQTSTGNGYRSPMLVEAPSEAPVRDTLSGLLMHAGDTPREALFAGLDRGIYLLACLGLHGADTARAAFSTAVYDGFAVEGGEITALLAPGSWNVAGHLFPEADDPGLFGPGQVQLSAEREITGSAKLPWIKTTLAIG